MKFIQLIEYKTSRPDEVKAAVREYMAQTEGKRAGVGYMSADRDEPGSYCSVVIFPSHDAAMKNNDFPETQALAAKMMELCDGPPTFHNLDVVLDVD